MNLPVIGRDDFEQFTQNKKKTFHWNTLGLCRKYAYRNESPSNSNNGQIVVDLLSILFPLETPDVYILIQPLLTIDERII